jgi:hypothetical protein
VFKDILRGIFNILKNILLKPSRNFYKKGSINPQAVRIRVKGYNSHSHSALEVGPIFGLPNVALKNAGNILPGCPSQSTELYDKHMNLIG